MEQVRRHDYEHYLCALHLEGRQRAAVLALRAFNVEIATVTNRAREPHLGLMRLVWWRDAIDALFKGHAPEHPVLRALQAVLAEVQLSKRWFSRLLEARIEDLDRETSPPTMEALEAYAENTASALLYLSLEAANVRSLSADHAASHIGKAEGLSLLLRGTLHHLQQRRSYIPLVTAAKHGLVQEDLYTGRGSEGLQDAVLEIASAAQAHLTKASALKSSVPPEVLRTFLPAVPARLYLQTLEAHNFNVLDPKLHRGICGVNPLWLQFQVALNSYRKTF